MKREDKIRLEICCGDIKSVIAAHEGGADCIELCSSIETGGITPSAGLIKEACRIFPGNVNVLIRPRPGDFLYDEDELKLIIQDIQRAIELGASGIVCGALDADGDIDIPVLNRMIEAAGGIPFTFHRAFDVCSNPQKTLHLLRELGCHTILTSGGKPSALQGVDELRNLVITSHGEIEIKAAAGISAENAEYIIRHSGVRIIHASAKTILESKMRYRNRDVCMGANPSDEYSRVATSAELVRVIRNIIDKI